MRKAGFKFVMCGFCLKQGLGELGTAKYTVVAGGIMWRCPENGLIVLFSERPMNSSDVISG